MSEKSNNETRFSCILIDDDPWAIEAVRRSLPLDEMGFEVIGEYENVQDAEQAILTKRPDLVISDICLGVNSGLDLVESCRIKNIPSKFILVSGYSNFEYARRAIHADVSTYLLKPIDCAEGREALRKVRDAIVGQPIRYEFSQHTIDRIRNYIRENYQSALSLDDLANTFHINRTYLSELFREKYGKNFVQYKNEVRIEHAKMMLNDTQMPIAEIATQCGFDNISYFAMVFKQITGMPPKQYRKESNHI